MTDNKDANIKETNSTVTPDSGQLPTTPAAESTPTAESTPAAESAPAKQSVSPSGSRRRPPKRLVDRRSRRIGRISLLTTLVVLAIVILVNIVLETVVGDRLSWDLTQNQLMSIGEKTEELLERLEEDVHISYLGTENDLLNHSTLAFVPQLLNDYVNRGRGHIIVEYVDPVADPSVISRLDPQSIHQLSERQFVVQNRANGRLRVLSQQDLVATQLNQQTLQTVMTGYSAENAFSGAINYVTLDIVPTVYRLTGHGEPPLEESFQVLGGLMDANGFDVSDINLLTVEKVPEDAAVLLILAPPADISGPEADRIIAWIKTGGSIMVAPGAFTGQDFANLNRVLQEFNIELTSDRVREGDSSLHLPNYPTYILAGAPKNDITTGSVPETLISEAAGVKILQNPVEWIETSVLLKTSDMAVLEEGGNPASISPEGVQNLAVMSDSTGYMDGTNVKHSSRAVVFGSSSVFDDQTFSLVGYQAYNYMLTYLSFDWLSQGQTDVNKLVIPNKQLASYKIQHTGSTTPIYAAAIGTAVVLPLLMLLLAIIVYRRRKHL
ncbi:MAG: GldG family protein [Bacillota bacterium]|nr:GldG family protein [Bacillota bacterium]